jgi:hypothetical protein
VSLRKRYLNALREIALGMPTGPFQNGFFEEFWESFSDFAWHWSMFFVWLISLATYPLSIFFFAGLAVYTESKRLAANRIAHEEAIAKLNARGNLE